VSLVPARCGWGAGSAEPEIRVSIAATISWCSSRSVAATLDANIYQRGLKITDKEMTAFDARHLHRHDFHGNWNYIIRPEPPQETTRPGEPNAYLADNDDRARSRGAAVRLPAA